MAMKKKVKVKKRKSETSLPILPTEMVEDGGAPVLAKLPAMQEPSLVENLTPMQTEGTGFQSYNTPSSVQAAADKALRKKVRRKKKSN